VGRRNQDGVRRATKRGLLCFNGVDAPAELREIASDTDATIRKGVLDERPQFPYRDGGLPAQARNRRVGAGHDTSYAGVMGAGKIAPLLRMRQRGLMRVPEMPHMGHLKQTL
jgi:hypothetical protein